MNLNPFKKASVDANGNAVSGFVGIAQIQNGRVLSILVGVMLISTIGFYMYITRDKAKEEAVPSTAAYVGDNNAIESHNGTPSVEIANKKIEDDIEKSNAASKNGESSVPEFPVSNEVKIGANGQPLYPTQQADDLSSGHKVSTMAPVDAYSTKRAEQEGVNYPSNNNQSGQQSQNNEPSSEFKSKSEQYKALIALNGYTRSVSGGETKVSSVADTPKPNSDKVTDTVTPVKNRALQAGQTAMVEISTKINTDRPLVVFGNIVSGKLKGNVLIGAASRNEDDSVSVSFNKISTSGENGKTYPIVAIALDPITGESGLTGDVNHKIMQRFILPMAAVAIGTYGQLIAQTNQTTTTTGNISVTQQNRVDTNRVVQASAGAAATQAATQFNKGAAAVPATTLPANLLIEVKFIEDVIL